MSAFKCSGKCYGFFNLLAIGLISAQLPSAFAASGGDGAGFNGPTLSPVSIPLQSERGLQPKDLEKAVDVCFVTGNPDTGIVSVVQRLASQVWPQDDLAKDFEFTRNVYTQEPNAEQPQDGTERWHGAYIEKNKIFPSFHIFDHKYPARWRGAGCNYFDGGKKEGSNEISHSTFGISLEKDRLSGFGSPDGVIQCYMNRLDFNLSSELPYIEFARSVDDSTYDQWGRVIQPRTLLQGVRIVVPRGSERSVTLINDKTQRPTGVTLNTVEYVQCLRSQIQKGSEH